MKKTIILSLALFLLMLVPHVFAQTTPQGFTALAPIPGLTDQSATSVISSTSLANFFNNLYKYLIGLAAALAVIEIVWGGLEISTKDSVSRQSDGRARITQAILGLVLVLSPVLVFSVINPSILNLSLNLPKLDTTTTTIQPVQQPPSGGGGIGGDQEAFALCSGGACTPQAACASIDSAIGATPYTPKTPPFVCVSSGSVDPSGATATNGNGATACKTGETLVVDCTRPLAGQ